MVASTSPSTSSPNTKGAITQNGVESNTGAKPKTSNEKVAAKSIPKGKYTFVGIDIDTTGRRLIDEIVQLAAFTPSNHYSQYIMPYMNLNPAARQRHQVRVISIGFYRMLKSTQTYKIIKSKSEIAALKDFLDWLEALKAKDENTDGVILVYYEERKFIPYMVLESLKKYNLLDRFLNTVIAFANGLDLAKTHADQALQNYSLRKLSKHLKENLTNIKVEHNNNMTEPSKPDLEAPQVQFPEKQVAEKKREKPNRNYDRDGYDGNASVRAKLAYEVTLHLSNQGIKDSLEPTNGADNMLVALQPHAHPIECDISELQAQSDNIDRQNSFRPVFLNYFKSTLYHRVRAVKFRIILAENNYNLQAFNDIWTEKKRDGILEVLQSMDALKAEERNELADLFDSFFDPGKTTIKPVVKTNNNRRRNRRVRNAVKNNDGNTVRSNGNEQGAGGDKQNSGNNSANLPDSTTKSPKNQRGKRNSRSQTNKGLLNPQSSNSQTDNANQINNATTPTATPMAYN